MFYFLISIFLYAIPTWAQSPLWGQCGGIGWSGSTTCASGSVCTYSNAYYSQCLPGNPSVAPPPPPPPATSAPPSPTTSTPAPTTSVPGSSPTNPGTSSTSPGPSSCPAFPSSVALPLNTLLPDPFQFLSGSRVTTKADFTCRQQEISQLFQNYELGALPGPPSSVTGSMSGNTLTVTVTEAGKSISFTASITYPSTGTAPYPAIIGFIGGSIPIPAGVALINYNNDDIAAEVSASGSRGVGKFYTLYGSSATAGAMTAWAWGVSRIMDALETTPGARINPAKVGVTGCSRDGKGAMAAGALEPRIVLTIPQESGSGGAACWRISGAALAAGANIQTAPEIVGEDPWFSTAFNTYCKEVNNLPFDHHMLAGLVAPRAMLVIENNIDWLGPQSTYPCMKTASYIWQALGVPDNFGFSGTAPHSHCAFPSSQTAVLNAFINKFLLGQSTDTSGVMQTDQTSVNPASWINWSVPTLT